VISASEPEATMIDRFKGAQDLDAAAYWVGREFKKYVVTVMAGPLKRPTFQAIMYVRARSSIRAIECAKRNLLWKVGRARFSARLARPSDLGCVRTGGAPENR
jgi:hypothetical protein